LEDALSRAVTTLRRKERSVGELDAWLAKRGVEDDERRDLLNQLLALGELDDERFAQRFAEDKRELAGWGGERIREALLARRIDPRTIESVLAGDGEEEQLDRATALLQRSAADLDDDASRARALAFLTRRGYAHEIAHSAIRRTEQAARSGDLPADPVVNTIPGRPSAA
jgi:regulatory protein